MRLAALLLALGLSCCAQAENRLVPTIAPGYVPSFAADELGLWGELEDMESAVQRSALRVHDPELNAYVRNALCRVARDYCEDLRLYIIRNPAFNASMTANGVVQVWTGLLLRVSSEDELAAVLGHELAHYTQLHTLERMRKASDAMATGSVLDLGLLVLTGINIPAAQMSAAASIMSFNRSQETEADLLGVQFMADADYDPTAAARVWEMMVAEEEKAVAKRQKPGVFNNTHPNSEARIVHLNRYVRDNIVSTAAPAAGQRRHVEMLNRHYMFLMEDQLDTNRYGRTEAMLERHKAIGVDENLTEFFAGELYQQRKEDGDLERAVAAYSAATEGDQPVAEAFHQLGYLYMKLGDNAAAKSNFEHFLQLEPDSGDRAMIEFYLEDLQ